MFGFFSTSQPFLWLNSFAIHHPSAMLREYKSSNNPCKIKQIITIALISFSLACCAPWPRVVPTATTITIATTTPLAVTDEYAHYYEQGRSFYQAGDIEQAISSLSKAININPQDTAAYLLQAEVYRSVQEDEKSLEDIDTVLELDPHNSDAHILRGLVFFDTKKYEEAITEYTLALDLSKENKLPLYYRALAYSSNGEYQLAIDDFQQYLVLVPNTPNRGRIEAMIASLKTQIPE